MPTILIESEQQLLDSLKKSESYRDFVDLQLKHKEEREKQAWKMLHDNKGRFTKELLNKVFDVVDNVDKEGPKKRWFGSLLATPNRKWILESPLEQIAAWIERLCFSELPVENILDGCLGGNVKIKGASKGLATLFLYLSAPEKYSIWVNKTYEGLSAIGRVGDSRNANWGDKYVAFNNGARRFAKDYSIACRELDWVLSFLGRHVKATPGGKYSLDTTEGKLMGRVAKEVMITRWLKQGWSKEEIEKEFLRMYASQGEEFATKRFGIYWRIATKEGKHESGSDGGR